MFVVIARVFLVYRANVKSEKLLPLIEPFFGFTQDLDKYDDYYSYRREIKRMHITLIEHNDTLH